jgi:HEPN domain-containing protein
MNPPPEKRQPASPRDWIIHARSDLTLARIGLQPGILPEQICFHAQQSAEKALKAVLLHASIDFPFTHDVGQLLNTLETGGIAVPDELKEIDLLTPYAVESRYPGYWGNISTADVTEALSLAEKTVEWAEKVIQAR